MFNEPLAPQTPCEPAISVALVEDEIGTRERLVRALGQTSRLCLAHAAGTAQELLDWLANNSVDVLLVDLGLPDLPGLEVIRRARAMSPGTEIMVITLFGDEANMMRAFEAGARGYLMKETAAENLITAIRKVFTGGLYVSESLAAKMLEQLALGRPKQAGGGVDALTDRELEVLEAIGAGKATKIIAEQLSISARTVEAHRAHIKEKLNITDGSSLVRFAGQWVESRAGLA